MSNSSSDSHLSWVISQKWSHLLFLNYSIDAKLIQDRLPDGITVDTFDGKAYLSIVPFYMSAIRFFFTPTLPFAKLYELNIRTYVKVNGVPGIYFFTLDTDHHFAAFMARTFFALPYRYQQMKISVHDHYEFNSPQFKCEVKIGETKEKDALETWLCERYSLFTTKNNHIYQGIAMHEPWRIRNVNIIKMKQDFLESFHFSDYTFENIFAGDSLEVKFKPFRRLT